MSEGVGYRTALPPIAPFGVRAAALSLGTRLTGAVAAPVRFAPSPRLPFNKLKKHGGRVPAVDGEAM
jgi:hypothetical protein